MESRFNEPLYKEVVNITNDFLYPQNRKIYEKKKILDLTKPCGPLASSTPNLVPRVFDQKARELQRTLGYLEMTSGLFIPLHFR